MPRAPESFVVHVAPGGVDSFAIPFLYISTDDIHLFINGLPNDALILGFPTPTTIQLTFTPVVTTLVELRRDTDNVRLVDFATAGAVREADLDTDGRQAIFVASEADEQILDFIVAIGSGYSGIPQTHSSTRLREGMWDIHWEWHLEGSGGVAHNHLFAQFELYVGPLGTDSDPLIHSWDKKMIQGVMEANTGLSLRVPFDDLDKATIKLVGVFDLALSTHTCSTRGAGRERQMTLVRTRDRYTGE